MPSRRESEVSVSENGWLEIGLVTRPHGIQGEVRVHVAAKYSAALVGVKRIHVRLEGRGGSETLPYCVEAHRMHQDVLLLKLKGVDTRDAAERLRGAAVLIQVDDLPELDEGDYYVHELLGLRVEVEAGAGLGELVEVIVTGANDVYVVKGGDGKEILLPAIESVVRNVDLDSGVMKVVIPEGLLG